MNLSSKSWGFTKDEIIYMVVLVVSFIDSLKTLIEPFLSEEEKHEKVICFNYGICICIITCSV